MKIGFNARLLSAPSLRGWNRYTVNLLAELTALEVQVILYADQPIHLSHLERLSAGSYQVRVAPPMRYLQWEQVWLPQQCAVDQVDILHCPFNFGLPWFSPCPRVLTLHDAIDQVYYGPQLSWGERLSAGHLLNQAYSWIARTCAERIITVSHHSKQDLIQSLQIPKEKISVIYEAADERFHRLISEDHIQAVRSRHQLNKPYIFYIGGWEKRKNIPFLIEAFAEANVPGVELVLAGGQPTQKTALQELARSLGVGDRLHCLDWVDDADLPTLYAGAHCFVYPSEYEGFGLQICEAMAVGCPIVAANATCLPEVLGSGGVTFGLSDTQELAKLLHPLSTDLDYRTELKNKAKRRSNEFSWHMTARETMKIYRSMMSASPKLKMKTATLPNHE
jgi:glycosyltransferase involved in cell wall biosynthesis